MANTTYNLGRVGLKLRGEYDPNAAYKPLDVVSWHGGSYAAKADTTGIAPSDSDKWEVLAQGLPAHSTGEQATGSCWLDGKPIYAKTLLIATPATANASITHALDMSYMDTAWVDTSSTFWMRTEGTLVDHLGYVASDSGRQFMVQLQRETNSILVVSDGAGRATIRILYTRNADAPAYYHLPFLTANSDQGCVASASSEYNTGNQRAWNGFSGDPQTEWCSTTADTNRWLQIRMPYGVAQPLEVLRRLGLILQKGRTAEGAGLDCRQHAEEIRIELYGYQQVVIICLVDGMQLIANDVEHFAFAQYVGLTLNVDANGAARHVDQFFLGMPVKLVGAQTLNEHFDGDGVVKKDLLKVLPQRHRKFLHSAILLIMV